jgi:hypothetical protein
LSGDEASITTSKARTFQRFRNGVSKGRSSGEAQKIFKANTLSQYKESSTTLQTVWPGLLTVSKSHAFNALMRSDGSVFHRLLLQQEASLGIMRPSLPVPGKASRGF